MKIITAEHFGMCFGVRDAIAQAEQLAHEGPLTILGELVHNPIVRERLRARGVAEGSLDQSGSTSQRVMITAHGASDEKRVAAKQFAVIGHTRFFDSCVARSDSSSRFNCWSQPSWSAQLITGSCKRARATRYWTKRAR